MSNPQGGVPRPKTVAIADSQAKLRELHRIEHAARIRERRVGLSPLSLMQSGVWLCVFAIVWWLLQFVSNFAFTLKPEISFLTAVGCGFAALVAFRLRYSGPRTWDERLDQLLTAYQPANRDAFSALQEKCASLGLKHAFIAVLEWVPIEQNAIRGAGAGSKERFEFLERKI